ncbi:uncharacterized protein LOC120843379, partial [Ixodes scapularis]|uniref:uncharacterized protein LOC120843379 n=1 Tax=Ixodes scapularis TaxID=6945 RepID=UPI001A9DFD5B
MACPLGLCFREIPVFLAALKWLNHDYTKRQQYLVQLLKCVRFSMMNREEIVHCLHPPLLSNITRFPSVAFMILSAFGTFCFAAVYRVVSMQEEGREHLMSRFASPNRVYLRPSKERHPLWLKTFLGDSSAPAAIVEILEKGPKFATEPSVKPTEMLALVRQVSGKVTPDNRERCVLECVEGLTKEGRRPVRKMKLSADVPFFKESKLKLLLSDKEGGFVVVPDNMFKEKSRNAMQNNFRSLSGVDLKKVKARAVQLSVDLNLDRLRKSVLGAKCLSLEAFFTGKTHKELMPFRAIVTQKDSWQLHVSSFLQRHLSSLTLNDPFLIRNSEALVEYLRGDNPGSCDIVSLDVEDMFYSIPHGELMTAVEECIHTNGAVAFSSSSGVSCDSFLELLHFYIQSTYVTYEGDTFLQKSGICIGSSVAPVLSDIYLARCDRGIAGRLDGRVLKVLRYVDDYLIVLKPSLDNDCVETVKEIVDIFSECSQGLSFKLEVPTEGALQFLDINLRLGTSHVCWAYDPRSKKGLLPYDSALSKLVKRAIAGSCLRASLLKSCRHRCGSSFMTQVDRLASAGFPSAVVGGVAESLVRMFRGHASPRKKQRPSTRPVVLPYIHALSHRIKRVAGRFEVPVVFSAPSKLSHLCAAVSREG